MTHKIAKGLSVIPPLAVPWSILLYANRKGDSIKTKHALRKCKTIMTLHFFN